LEVDVECEDDEEEEDDDEDDEDSLWISPVGIKASVIRFV